MKKNPKPKTIYICLEFNLNFFNSFEFQIQSGLSFNKSYHKRYQICWYSKRPRMISSLTTQRRNAMSIHQDPQILKVTSISHP